jgi:hypothetical protein
MEVVHDTVWGWIDALRSLRPVVNADDPLGRRVGFHGKDGTLHSIRLTELKATSPALSDAERQLLLTPEGRAKLLDG